MSSRLSISTAPQAEPINVSAVKSFHVTTFGCQMNEHDSERMKGMLDSLGYQEIGRAVV